MGMTIGEAQTALGKERKYALHENKQAYDIAIETMRKYQIMQADYENRLKADMVAMLTELQAEIEKVPKYRITHNNLCVYREAEEYISDINKVIQQKINLLKENENGDK